MKIRLFVSEDKKATLEQKLSKLNAEICDETYEYTLVERFNAMHKVLGEINGTLYPLKISDLMYFESLNGAVFAYDAHRAYTIKYKLYELEQLLVYASFMRISQSVIVNLEKIKSIHPTLNRKFILTMKNNAKVDVTRSYYYLFKNYIERT